MATPSKRIDMLQSALVARLRHSFREHHAVLEALALIKLDVGRVRTDQIAEHLGFSQRHFIKMFSEQVGVTPKLFGRVSRFQNALELTRDRAEPKWADIAAVCGYFDQSHMIRDFQMFTGQSPKDFQAKRVVRDIVQPPVIDQVKFFQYETTALFENV